MRGQQSLFDDFRSGPDPAPSEKKGRNEELHAQRNELLFHRYYYYTAIVRRQYGDTLQLLSREFFLTEIRISDILMADRSQLAALYKARPEIAYFKKKYDWWVW